MTQPTANISKYRPCAAIALFNADGKVWLGKRAGAKLAYSWQMPQGGLDAGESAKNGAIRELIEETGVPLDCLSPLGQVDDWLYYDIPKGHGKRTRQNWRGQRQKWFALRFSGQDTDFNLNFHEPAEFSQFRWADINEAVELIVPFKREVYERVAVEFERFARPAN